MQEALTAPTLLDEPESRLPPAIFYNLLLTARRP